MICLLNPMDFIRSLHFLCHFLQQVLQGKHLQVCSLRSLGNSLYGSFSLLNNKLKVHCIWEAKDISQGRKSGQEHLTTQRANYHTPSDCLTVPTRAFHPISFLSSALSLANPFLTKHLWTSSDSYLIQDKDTTSTLSLNSLISEEIFQVFSTCILT